ncbi:DUF4232 domain-containing protein [Streptomyces muensis]|uniref:DUF4232 domain-containing protein n=1 Tax=Streptomyces muensis TaxID=1077944 RepID=A0A9X1PTK5_STRM4|nr:DUF4232 domain-containing protein [Streptomyces muensis]MCF1593340.1 DUF4232 domain-containing protein [Streptomyces muensis]
MSDFRTSRTSRTRLVAAATAVLATLCLSACNDGTGTKDEGAAATTTSTGSATATPSEGSGGNSASGTSGSSGSSTSGSNGSGSSGGGAGGTDSGSTDQAPATKAPASSGKPVTCEGSNTKTVAAPLNRPVNHMLLTVTNTGSRTCFLYGYPAVRFGEAQSVPPVIEESQPQAVVTLEPGQSGYASVSLSATDGSASGGRTEKSLAVSFFGRSMSRSVGAAAHPSLPANGVHIDDSLKVTYWQQSMDDATSW